MVHDSSTIHVFNPQVPYFNGTIEESIAAGAFPLHVSTETVASVAASFESIFGPTMVMFQNTMMTYLPGPTTFMKEWVNATIHPLSRKFPLMDPIDDIYCILLYFVLLGFFFLVGRVTGKLQLRTFGIVHNLFLAVFSLYMGVGFIWDNVALYGLKFWNNSIDASHPISLGASQMAWIFTASKLYEFFDTFIMVLKHNYRQVSFLHLYHHASVFLVCTVYIIYAPGSDVTWAGLVNSLIHVVMYTYYLLNLVFTKGPVKDFIQRNKFIITRCQITQFVLNAVQAIYVLFLASSMNCRKEPMVINFIYMVTLIALFLNFMVQNQKLAAAAKKKSTKSKKE